MHSCTQNRVSIEAGGKFQIGFIPSVCHTICMYGKIERERERAQKSSETRVISRWKCATSLGMARCITCLCVLRLFFAIPVCVCVFASWMTTCNCKHNFRSAGKSWRTNFAEICFWISAIQKNYSNLDVVCLQILQKYATNIKRESEKEQTNLYECLCVRYDVYC